MTSLLNLKHDFNSLKRDESPLSVNAVITTDARGMVIGLNDRAEALTGWTQGDASGRPFRTVFAVADPTVGEFVAKQELDVKFSLDFLETGLTAKNGMLHYVEGSAVKTGKRGKLMSVSSFSDTSPQTRCEKPRCNGN